MVAVATDGAAVVTGKKSGVVQRLLPQRLGRSQELCSDWGEVRRCAATERDTARYPNLSLYRPPTAAGMWRCYRPIPYLVKFKGLLNAILKYFKNPGKNTASLDAKPDMQQ